MRRTAVVLILPLVAISCSTRSPGPTATHTPSPSVSTTVDAGIAATTTIAASAAPTPDSDSVASSTTAPATTTTTSLAKTTATTTTTSTVPTSSSESPRPDWQTILGDVVSRWRSKGTPITPGVSVALLLPDDTEILLAQGVADLVTQVPVTVNDYFRIGSISKTITSVALLQLVHEGLVSLDEPAATYLGDLLVDYTLNDIDYGNSITVRQLLNHTDGFAEYAFDLGFYLAASERLDQAFEPEEIIDWGLSRGPQYVPGTAYSYNTVGHNVVGLVIEAVTGMQAHQVLRARIFDPLNLKGIFLPPAEDPPRPVVHGYAAGSLKTALDLIPATSSYPEATVGEVYDVSVIPQEAIRSAGWTGGSIEAQVQDVARIFRAIFDGTLLVEDMIDELLTTSAFSNYGLGISIGEADVNTAGAIAEASEGTVSFSHGGGVPGFRSYAAYYPTLRAALAISTNVIPVEPDVSALAEDIIAALLETRHITLHDDNLLVGP